MYSPFAVVSVSSAARRSETNHL